MHEGSVVESPLHLFEAVGIELELMIVDADTLNVRPICDQLLRSTSGELVSELELGDVAWSNELALHVVELKTNGPAASTDGLGALFQKHVALVGERLEPHGARLLPTAMHPWMVPDHELRLWPHGDRAIYEAFDRVFDCRGHGWANLQSMHVNLPFADDSELRLLHAAIRVILPLLPGLAASSPIVEGRLTGHMDTRLEVYRTNARAVPSVAGVIVPEPVYTRASYEKDLLGRIYADLAPLDPDAVLQHEWVNSRGCIARFDRMALEIRLIDTQECPAADLAVASLVIAAVRGLVEGRWSAPSAQLAWDEKRLAQLLRQIARDGDEAVLDDREYLGLFGLGRRTSVRAKEVWQHLASHVPACDQSEPLAVILEEGCLARRITRAVGSSPSRRRLRSVYGRLADCLSEGAMFRP